MIVDEFTASLENFVGRITEGTATPTPTIYKLEMHQLNAKLLNIGEKEIETTGEHTKGVIRTCVGKLFGVVVQLEHIQDNLTWFLINLYLSKFVRIVYPEIKLFWPILDKVFVYTEDIKVLYSLIDNSLAEKSTISWLTSRILLHIVQEKNIADLVKERINTKENVKRFKNILRLNHDITTELNLILLFVDLELEAVFLPNLVEPYVSYIQSINSNFKRFIPCSTLSKDCQLLNCANSFIQPVDGYLLVLWFQSGEANPEPYYVNLMTLKSFRALPDGVIRLNFTCDNQRSMRSEQVSVYKHMTKFSVKAETEEVLDVSIEFKLTNQSHYSWLVGYLKRNVSHRKVSINSTLQVSSSQAEESQLRNSMQLEPFVGIKKRKFSRYGSLDEVSERRPRKQMRRSIMVKQDCPTQQSADEIEESSCGVADKSDVKDNEREVSIASSKNDGNHDEFSQEQSFIEETTISEPDETKAEGNVDKPVTAGITESLKLFTSTLVKKMESIESTVLDKKTQLQQQLDTEFARIEAMHKQKLKEISKYVADELNKFM